MPETPAVPTAALAAPTPLSPTGGAVVARDDVPFRWAARPGARRFDLRVAAADAPGTALVERSDLLAAETTVAGGLPDGACVWWVRQSGGAWSPAARFVVGAPADSEAAPAPRARRDAVAEGFVVPPEPVWPHAEGPALAGAPPLDWSTIPGFGAAMPDAAPTVGAAPPRPLAPLGGEVVDAAIVSLRWAGVPGADGYALQLSPEAAFGRDVLALDAGAATELTLPGLLPATGHRLFWRVRARTAAGPTAWSRHGRFYATVGAPVDRFRADREAAVAAYRKRRDYDRRERDHALDQVALYERPQEETDAATYIGVVLMMGLVIVAAAALFVLSLVL